MMSKMSKLLVLLFPVLLLAGCNKDDSAASSAPTQLPSAGQPAAAAKDAAVELGAIGDDGMPALAHRSNCAACHVIEGKKLGPSWMDVARKYKGMATYKFNGKDYPLEEGLFQKVAKGGAGVWGTMPMPANSPAVKDDEIRLLVKFILSLSK